MDPSHLHFAQPLWLWALVVLPVVWGLAWMFTGLPQPRHQLEKFIDKHLLAHLLIPNVVKQSRRWVSVAIWSLVWACLAFALAGPRWDFREITSLSRDQNLVILLDLSESMNATDMAPSRLARAKQKIEDLLKLSKGVKVGLIAFAADPHMISPMTDDKDTIRHLLPSLDTDLVYVQGSKLAPALDMAESLLAIDSSDNKAIVVISDGGFEDSSAIQTAKQLAAKDIVIHTIGVGTVEGIPLKNRQGALVKKNGSVILSKLEKEKFREISTAGHGRYFDADHAEPIGRIFNDLEKRGSLQQDQHKTLRIWEEHFWLFLLPAIPLFLWWFRQGALLATLILFCFPCHGYADVASLFQNAEQQACAAFEKDDFATAADGFQDSYRKGVACYRKGDYAAAAKQFKQSTRPEVACNAGYNLGNALAQQNKLREAIKAYEKVLEKWPDHTQTKENLELVKKMLEEQQKQNEQQDPQDNDSDDESDKDSDKQNQEQQQQQPSEQEDDPQDQESEPEEQTEPESEPESDADDEPEECQPDSATEEEQEEQPESSEPEEDQEKAQPRSQEDLDADLWLDQIKNDPKAFLKRKFFLESRNTGTKQDVDPW